MQTESELYRRLEPLIQRQISASISSATSSSATLSPTLTGALLADGSVSLSGNLIVASGKLIDGWDIDTSFSYLYSMVAATEAFTYSGLGLSNTDDGATYTLILTSSSYPGAAASILATDSSGRLGVQNLGLGIAAQTGYALYSNVASPSYFANDVRVGTTAAGALAARLHVLTTGTQFQASYDTSNYGFIGVGSAGTLTIGNTGTTAANAHIYFNPGGGSAKVGIGNSIPTPTAKLEVNSITEQLRLNYSGAVYAAFTVSSAGNLTIDASGANIYTSEHIGHPSYASQLTAWRISSAGEADFRYLYTDELHAKAFIADLEQALAGGQIISKSVAKVYTNFTVPTAGNTGNLDVEEFAGFAGFHVFVDGDLVRLRQFNRTGGGLTIADIWGTVVYSAQVAGSNPPAQRYVFTRHASFPGTGSGTVNAGTLVLDYGTTGNGYYEVNAIDGAAGANSPYTQIVTWATHPKSTTANQGLQLRVRMGQLRGLTGVSQFGLYAGTGWTANPQESNVAQYSVTTPTVNDQHRYILAGDNGVDIYNANLQVYSGTTPVITLDRTGPDLAVGSGSDTMTYSSGSAGFWVGNDSGTYKMRLGSVSGGLLTQGLSWDGSRLNVVGNVSLGPSTTLNYGVSIGNPALMLRFDGDYTGHRGQVATTSGGVVFVKGKFGRAASIGEATTNLVSNPSFEKETGTSITSWTQETSGAGSGFVSTVDTTWSEFGTNAYHLVNADGTNYRRIRQSLGVLAAGSYTVTFTGRVVSGAGGYAQVYNGTSTVASVTWTANGRYSMSFTANGSNTYTIYLQAGPNINSITEIYYDGIQAENKSYATPYCDGSLGAGHSWSGTAHASSSSRTIGLLQYPASYSSSSGTFSAWVHAANVSQTWAMLISDVTAGIAIYCSGSTINVSRKDTEAVTSAAIGVTALTWHLITVTWSGRVAKIYYDGTLINAGAATGDFAVAAAWYVGKYNSGGTFPMNGLMDDAFVSTSVLSDDEVRAIYLSNAPVAINNDPYSLYLYGDNTQGFVRGNATGLFGYSDQTGGAGTGAFALVTTNSTALGTAFGSVTLDAGDAMLGSASSGKSNLYWDQSAGSLSFRVATTNRMILDTSGNLSIKNGVGTDMLLLNGAETLARLTGILFVDSNGEIRSGNGTVGGGTFTGIRIMNYGAATVMGGYYNDALQWDIGTAGQMRFGVVAGNPSVTLDSSGITMVTPTAYSDINTIKWKYSSAITGKIYSLADTGAGVSGSLVIQAAPYSGGTYGYLELDAASSSNVAVRLMLSGTPNNATRGPDSTTTFYNTSGTKIGGNLIYCSTAGTSASMTAASAVRYRMHYRLVVRASGGGNATLTGDLGLGANNTVTVGGTANDFRVGVDATGYIYWSRQTGAETYEVTFWAIYV